MIMTSKTTNNDDDDDAMMLINDYSGWFQWCDGIKKKLTTGNQTGSSFSLRKKNIFLNVCDEYG